MVQDEDDVNERSHDAAVDGSSRTEESERSSSASQGEHDPGDRGLGGEDLLVEEGEIAGDYLEQLLDVLDYDGDIDLDVDGKRAIVSVEGGGDLNMLVGQNGKVLDALQELTRLAVQQQTGVRSRLMLDVDGWRSNKRTEITNLGTKAAGRVEKSGEREELEPMSPFERKIVHDAVAAVEGVTSESTGTDSGRRVVIRPE